MNMLNELPNDLEAVRLRLNEVKLPLSGLPINADERGLDHLHKDAVEVSLIGGERRALILLKLMVPSRLGPLLLW